MKHGADWYKREPTAYLGGVQGMSAKEHAVFSVVLDLIYQHGGSVNNDAAWFSGWICDMGAAAVRATVTSLIDRGKLCLEDGQLSNNRAKTQAKTKENLSENRAKIGKEGGISSGVSRAALNEIKGLGEAIASPREEKIREELYKKEEEGASAKSISVFQEVMIALGVDPEAPPKYWRGKTAETHVAAWQVAHGLTGDEVVEAARLSRRDNAEPPDGPKAIDRYIASYATAKAAAKGAASPKIRARLQEATSASPDEIAAHWADTINKGGFVAQSAMTPNFARELIERGLVTGERLKEIGVQF
jgi:hypothetical protein